MERSKCTPRASGKSNFEAGRDYALLTDAEDAHSITVNSDNYKRHMLEYELGVRLGRMACSQDGDKSNQNSIFEDFSNACLYLLV